MVKKDTVEVFDIGDHVECDLCSKDFTHSDAKGGFLFLSKGVCPVCAPHFEADIMGYNEEQYIRDRARPDETFKAFIMRVRGGNNTVTIRSF